MASPKIPKSVERQAEEAERLLQELQPKPQDEGKTEETPAPEPEVKEPDSKEEPKVEEEAPPQPTAPDAKEYERLQQAHKVLQGKYNAEVPRMAERIRFLEEQLVSKANNAPEKKETAPTPKTIDGVLKKLRGDYGDDFADGVSELIDARIDDKLNTALKTVNANVENVSQVVHMTREDRFREELTELVPNWKTIYADPEFSNFLDREDALSGLTLRDLAQDANKKLDAKRLAKFYKAFDKESNPQSKEPESKTPAEAKPKVDKREALITPATGTKQNNSAVGGEKPDYIRASEIDKFSKDVSRGLYRHKPKEMDAYEARINRAIANGWVLEG